MASAAARRTPKKFRVLFTDAASSGRFEDVEAWNEGDAAWKVAIGMDGCTFIGIIAVPPGKATGD